MKTITLATVTLLFLSSFTIQAQDLNKLCNCCTEEYQEFDFWVGTWQVFDLGKKLAGINVIEKIQDRCALRENWKSAVSKYTGTSYSFYNSQTKQWEHIWTDNQGGSLKLKGGKVKNQMILVGDEVLNKKGEKVINRITWTSNSDGTLSQHWETTADNKTWATAFHATYKKVQ